MVLLGRVLLAIALLGTVGSTLRAYPHQLAYFNELAGGPHEGWRHMLGSSVDWGQDLTYLNIWARAHSEAICAQLRPNSPYQVRLFPRIASACRGQIYIVMGAAAFSQAFQDRIEFAVRIERSLFALPADRISAQFQPIAPSSR